MSMLGAMDVDGVAIDVRTAHRGPHCLRHACAARLVAEGL
jgi:integrase